MVLGTCCLCPYGAVSRDSDLEIVLGQYIDTQSSDIRLVKVIHYAQEEFVVPTYVPTSSPSAKLEITYLIFQHSLLLDTFILSNNILIHWSI